MTDVNWIQQASQLSMVLILLGIIMAFVRLVRGPHAADRIVAMDLISILIIAFLTACSIFTGETSFLDVAISYALVAFLGTVALARYRERSAGRIAPSENQKER